MGVTGARGSFTVLMEPDEAPWKVTGLIKGATHWPVEGAGE